MARRDVVARWSALAERRLQYLTELFETGRWRRFHSELALLENIQEAKTAVEIWRDLSMREDFPEQFRRRHFLARSSRGSLAARRSIARPGPSVAAAASGDSGRTAATNYFDRPANRSGLFRGSAVSAGDGRRF